jgi:F0F1-type ATP synthase epsilon subunit
MTLVVIEPTISHTHLVEWVDITTPEGNRVILPGHCEAIFVLAPNTNLTFCLSNAQQKIIPVPHGGIIEVTRAYITAIIQHRIMKNTLSL